MLATISEKGSGHPARLNFGIALPTRSQRLLTSRFCFRGRDFIHVGLTPALREN